MSSPIPIPSHVGQGEWLPARAALGAPVGHEIALARELAVTSPQKFFDPKSGLRSIQALAPNTRRAYGADWRTFVECCRLHGHEPLPASHVALETFVEWRSPEQVELIKAGMYKYVRAGDARRPAAAASLERALAAIRGVHEWLGFPDPTRVQSVRDTFKINTRGLRTQSHKDPLRWEDLERAFAHMGSGLWALRDKALVAVAHSTMFRRSELVALTCEDYIRVPNADYGRMVIRKTKTEDPKDLKYRRLSPEALIHIENWLKAANITEGALFRGITPDRRLQDRPLGSGEVARAFKVVARAAGIQEINRIAGHSTRIGATHDLKAFGADTLDIMQEAGWKPATMPKRYLQGLSTDEGAMARMSAARRRSAGR